MVGGAAGDDVNLVGIFQVLSVDVQVIQHHPAILDAGKYRVSEGLGLLHDLLGHKVLVPAFFGGGDLPVHMVLFLLHRLEVGVIVDGDAVRREDGDFPILQIAYLPGVFDNGGHIAGHEMAALAIA